MDPLPVTSGVTSIRYAVFSATAVVMLVLSYFFFNRLNRNIGEQL